VTAECKALSTVDWRWVSAGGDARTVTVDAFWSCYQQWSVSWTAGHIFTAKARISGRLWVWCWQVMLQFYFLMSWRA